MPKSVSAIFLAALAAATFSARGFAAVIPPIGLTPGQQYQLIFVTADSRDGTSPNVADYNNFVNAEAALGVGSGLPSATWDAVVSTTSIAAKVNAPSLGLPIYNTQGQEVASGGTGLYTLNLLTPILYDQFGNANPSLVYSGSQFTGDPQPANFVLGGQFPSDGLSNTAGGGAWLQNGTVGQGTLLPFYALSGPITVPAPEPATITLVGSALLALAGLTMLRHNRRR